MVRIRPVGRWDRCFERELCLMLMRTVEARRKRSFIHLLFNCIATTRAAASQPQKRNFRKFVHFFLCKQNERKKKSKSKSKNISLITWPVAYLLVDACRTILCIFVVVYVWILKDIYFILFQLCRFNIWPGTTAEYQTNSGSCKVFSLLINEHCHCQIN